MKSTCMALGLLSVVTTAPIATAEARVAVPSRAIFSMEFANSTMYCDGCNWSRNDIPDADAIADAYQTYADGKGAGVDAFLFDFTSNGVGQRERARWFNAAARKWNSNNADNKICVAPLYEQVDAGVLALFDALDAGGSDSPLCKIDGAPVVGVWGNASCVNPLPELISRGPFVMIGTVYNTAENYPIASCVQSWKRSGAAKVLSYVWNSGNFASAEDPFAKKAHIEATGAIYVQGIGTARSENCGTDACAGPKSPQYVFRDGNGFGAFLRWWARSTSRSDDRSKAGPAIDYVMYTMGIRGDDGEGSYHSPALICDAADRVDHGSKRDGVRTAFTCPNIPPHLLGTKPSQHYRSHSNKAFTHRGFWRIDQEYASYFRTGTRPVISRPFIAFGYREHPFSMAGGDICPNAATVLARSSYRSRFWGDSIFVVNGSASPVKLRVTVGTTVLFNGVLPADQIWNTEGQQTVIPFGTARGRPLFEVLDAHGRVTSSYLGLVEYTDSPRQRNNRIGRNFSFYADYM
ncbi:MAG TPA: hypothetical protein PLJ47_15385 [Candidatus Hydrogenedentes bacterium]|nr:hypothetical protein [Candidatus Hydrogenedentota bacterium]